MANAYSFEWHIAIRIMNDLNKNRIQALHVIFEVFDSSNNNLFPLCDGKSLRAILVTIDTCVFSSSNVKKISLQRLCLNPTF